MSDDDLWRPKEPVRRRRRRPRPRAPASEPPSPPVSDETQPITGSPSARRTSRRAPAPYRHRRATRTAQPGPYGRPRRARTARTGSPSAASPSTRRRPTPTRAQRVRRPAEPYGVPYQPAYAGGDAARPPVGDDLDGARHRRPGRHRPLRRAHAGPVAGRLGRRRQGRARDRRAARAGTAGATRPRPARSWASSARAAGARDHRDHRLRRRSRRASPTTRPAAGPQHGLRTDQERLARKPRLRARSRPAPAR